MLTDIKTIYILYSYYPGDDNSTAVGWSESEDEIKDLKNKLEERPKCPYGKKKRRKIDYLLREWDEIEERLIADATTSCPYYDKTKVPQVTDMKMYSEWMGVLDKCLVSKRTEWFNENYPDVTTHEELVAYDEFLEKENWHMSYYIDKLNHI